MVATIIFDFARFSSVILRFTRGYGGRGGDGGEGGSAMLQFLEYSFEVVV